MGDESHLSVPHCLFHIRHPRLKTFAQENAPPTATTNFFLRCMTTPSGKRNRSIRKALITLKFTAGEERKRREKREEEEKGRERREEETKKRKEGRGDSSRRKRKKKGIEMM